MTSRRLFLAGSSAAVLATSPLLAQRRPSRAFLEPDLVVGEVARQAEDAAAVLNRGPSGEAARKMATAARTLSAWAKQSGLDAELRGVRLPVVLPAFSLSEELALRGLAVPPGTTFRPVDRRLLEAVKREGISGSLQQLAGILDAGSRELDRRGGLTPIALRQDDCQGLEFMEALLETWVFFFCLLLPVPEICVIMAAELVALKWYKWWRGC